MGESEDQSTINLHQSGLPVLKFTVTRAMGDSESLIFDLVATGESSVQARENMLWLMEQAAANQVLLRQESKKQPPNVG